MEVLATLATIAITLGIVCLMGLLWLIVMALRESARRPKPAVEAPGGEEVEGAESIEFKPERLLLSRETSEEYWRNSARRRRCDGQGSN